MVLALLSFVFHLNVGHALEFNSLKVGAVVELTENVSANTLKSGAYMICRWGEKALYPKVIVGPEEGVQVRSRYFTVAGVVTDPSGYEVQLRSDQMPCACVLGLMQWGIYLGGEGSDFKMLSPAPMGAQNELPPIESSCKDYPSWIQKPDSLKMLKI